MLFKAGTAVLLASTALAAGPNLDQIFAAQASAVSAASASSASAVSASASASVSASTSTSTKSKASASASKHQSSSSVSAHKSASASAKSASKSASKSSRSSVKLSHSSSKSASKAEHSESKTKSASEKSESKTKSASAKSESKAHSSAKSSATKAHSSAAAAHASSVKSTLSGEKSHASSAKSSSTKSTKSASKTSSSKLAHATKSASSSAKSSASSDLSASASAADASETESATSATASASSTPRARFAFAAHHGRGMERKLRSTRHKERDAAILALQDPADEVRKREVALMKRLAEDHGMRAAPEASRLRRRDADSVDVGQAHELVARASNSSAATASPAAPATSAIAKAVSTGYFHGASSYYLHAMASDDRYAVLDALKDGGFSVVRIFIASVEANNKGSNSRQVNDVEPNEVGTYDDTILDLVDQLMYDCSVRGLKLLITLGDRYALGWWSTDAYAQQLGIVKAGSSGVQQITDASAFYESSWAANAWDNRMAHILSHKNSLLGNKPWSQLSDVVYAFEPQNEPQGHMSLVSPNWVCNRAAKLQSLLSSAGSSILVSSGGGITTTSSLDDSFTGCSSLDVISVHDYGTDASTTVTALTNAQKALGSDKLVIMGEWGATGQNKATIVKNFVTGFKSAGIPQMVWEVTIPGKGAADFEISPESSDPIDKAAWSALTGGSAYVASSTTSAKASSTSTAQWHSSSASWSQHASSSSSSGSSSSSAAKAQSTDN